jgi:hypothetical protein
MMKQTKIAATAFLLLFGAAGCDLDVQNPNAPEQERALANPGDVEALVGGSWWSWYQAQHNFNISLSPMLSTMSFQHSAFPANFGMVDYSTIPRAPTINSTANPNYGNISGTWTQAYRAVAAVNDGLRAIDAGLVDLGPAATRARAYGKFVQGVGHGTIAMLYNAGPIVDETTDLTQTQEFVSYQELLQAALGYLDQAISLAGGGFHEPIPYDWMIMAEPVTAGQLIRMANSYKAMLRVANARTPAEAANINWAAVVQEINAGITDDVMFRFDGNTRWFGSLYYTLLGGWSQLNYTVHGMADQSGKYQEWMALPAGQRHPNLPSGAFLIITPDKRFPQGATLAAQLADLRPHPDMRFQIPRNAAGAVNTGDQWARDDRGTWRWSYYRDRRSPGLYADEGDVTPYISYREQRLLKAEAHIRLNQQAEAAAIINETRVPAGLNATNAAGLNSSCVPKLPNGSCGNLLEMLKWERRMMASHEGQYLMSTMYFDSRRWGDLMEGTVLNWPIPCRDAQLEPGMTCENYGGTLEWGAPVGTYGY